MREVFIVSAEAVFRDLGDSGRRWRWPWARAAGDAFPNPPAAGALRPLPLAGIVVLGVMVLWWRGPALLRPIPPAAAPVERLVVAVAPFAGPDEDSVKEGRVMGALVEKAIAQRLSPNGVTVLGIDQTAQPAADHAAARALAEKLGADIVVWGEVLAIRGETEIQPYFTLASRRSAARAPAADRFGEDALAAVGERVGEALVVGSGMPSQIEARKTTRRARKSRRSAWSKKGFRAGSRTVRTAFRSSGIQPGSPRCSSYGSATNAARSERPRTGAVSTVAMVPKGALIHRPPAGVVRRWTFCAACFAARERPPRRGKAPGFLLESSDTLSARDPRRAAGSRPGGAGRIKETRAISNKVFVGNLSFDVTREELIEAFSAAGRVVDADLYAEPYQSAVPVICFDEASYQMVSESRLPLLVRNGMPGRYDFEYSG